MLKLQLNDTISKHFLPILLIPLSEGFCNEALDEIINILFTMLTKPCTQWDAKLVYGVVFDIEL